FILYSDFLAPFSVSSSPNYKILYPSGFIRSPNALSISSESCIKNHIPIFLGDAEELRSSVCWYTALRQQLRLLLKRPHGLM
ncbi:hypothetical protein L9F63_015802, partial [Diploptera punctata]